jgi:large repetitive protein
MTSLRLGRLLLPIALAGAFFTAPALRADDPWAVTPALTSRAVFSCTDLTMSNGTVDSAGISANVGSNHGDIASNGNIRLSGNALVKGNAVAGPGRTFTVTGNGSITGTKTNAQTAENCIPVDLTNLVTTVKTTNDNSRIPLTQRGHNALGGSNHTDLSLTGQDTLTLASGTYYFTSISLTGGSTIVLSGDTRILCTGSVSITGGSVTNPNPFKLHLWVSGTAPFSLQGGAALTAFVYAPSASATIANGTLTGSLFANAVNITGPSQIRRAIDDAKPQVAITSPADGTIVSDPAHVPVRGTSSDGETGVASVQVNGHTATLAADGTWQITIDVSGASPATITALATDAAGNTASVTIKVITILPPTLTLTSPVPGSLINTRIVNVSGSAGNATSVTVNGTAAVVAGGVFSIANYDLGPDGAHPLTIVGTNAGGTTTIQKSVTTDTVPPTIRATVTPAPNANGWNNSNVTVTFLCDDPGGSGVKTCPPATTFTSEGVGLSVQGTATDNANNSSPKLTVLVNIDKTNPSPTFNSPKNNDVVTTQQITVTGYPDDSATVFVNGVAAVVDRSGAAPTFTSAPITLAGGNNSITATCTDPAGNNGSATMTVIFDNTPPKVSITSPVNGAIVSDIAHVAVTGSASDAETAVTVTVNGQNVSVASDGTFQTTVDLTGKSPATIIATATDSAGHSTPAQVTVTPIPPPTLSMTSPQPGTYVNTRTVALSGGSGTATSVTVNSQPATISNGVWTIASFDLGPDAMHTLTIVGTNGGGQVATITPTLGDDTIPPTIKATVTPAPNAAGWNNTDVTVSFACDDGTGSGILDCPASVTLTTEKAGQTVSKSAVDKANNSSAPASVTVNIDKTKPVPTITSHTDGQIVTDPQVTIVGGADDSVSVLVNNVPATVNTTAKTFTSAPITLVDGNNTITVTGTDVADNTSAPVKIALVLDNTPPQISITSPADGALVPDLAHVTVTGFASDSETPITVQVNGVPVAQASDGTFRTVVDVSGSTPAVITATALDAAGHLSPPAQVTVTTIPAPVLSLDNPAPGSIVNRNVVDLTGGSGTAVSVTVNSQAALVANKVWSFAGFDLGGEGAHTLTIVGTNALGTSTTLLPAPVITSDTIPPTIQAAISPAPNSDGWNNTDVTITFSCADVGTDIKTCPAPVTLTVEGPGQTVTRNAVDNAGNQTPISVTVNIDKTKPVITVSSQSNNQVLTDSHVIVSGSSGDARKVYVNGVAATLYGGSSFTSAPITLVEGSNTITVTGSDIAGNVADPVTLTLVLDTRAPQLSVTAPAANVCLAGTTVQVSGSATDPHLSTLKVSITPGSATVDATRNPDGTWSATLPLGADGSYLISATAADSYAHTAVATVPVTVDRTQPAIEITSGGAPFTGGAFNHAISINVRGIDADPAVALTTTLDGSPYVAGTSISTEEQHVVNVSARDCAGNTQQASANFKIDMTAPRFVTIAPATGSTVSSATTPITGTLDADDVVSVALDGSAIKTAPSGRNFTLNAPLAEGTNNLVLVATDDAGNSTRQSYSITVKTTTPSVQILESGLPIAPNALFNRNVTPLIVSNEAGVHPTATLDTVPYNSGTLITAEGQHTIVAHAADDYGHQSDATVTFTIDKTPPALTVTDPADGATLAASTVDVKGNAGDAVRLTVNGAPFTIGTQGTFVATIPLDLGTTTILVTASDAAGNSASVSRSVTRSDARPGLILTTPADGTVTNHATTTVAGQVLTPSLGAHVTINGTDVTPDPAGLFRIDGFALHDGDNAITALISGNTQSSVTVHVTSDIIPPALKVFANGIELQPAAHFTTSPAITLLATDNNPAGLTSTLTIDGTAVTGASPPLADGGHVLTATAQDAAHNQTRVDRAFSIGAGSAAAAGCTLSNFDPADGSAVFSSNITFSGRSGGAAGVIVNGAHVTSAEGSFAVSLALTNEGANTVTVRCADASGNQTSDAAVTETIYRYTNAPSITITAPVTESVLSASTVTVTGTVGAGVVSGDVNGIAFTPSGGTFSVPGVALVTGLNVITARGTNAASRVGIATVHVIVANGAPSITITSPLPATTTSAATTDVSGTWKNIDPTTLRVAGVAPTFTKTTDTTGTFVAPAVPLTPNATTTIPVTGQNGAGTAATASVDVQNAPGPSITITSPADNSWYAANATAPDAIAGTINAPPASTVSVNGVNATLTGSQFSAAISFAAGSTGVTTALARVTTPDGVSATDSVRLIQMPAALTVLSAFPQAGATAVDPGVLVVVLFSNPLGGTGIANSGAVTLADDAGHTITGFTFIDNDALSFAPNVPLTAGSHYTFTVGQTLKDRAGQTLASPYVLSFTVASGASGIPPVITSTGSLQGCLSVVNIAGTASAAGVRVRLTVDGVTTSTIAGADAKFAFTASLSGQPGFHVARIREVGADGSLSPESDVTYEINCGAPAGPTVTGATLDRNARTLAVQFSKAMNLSTLTASATGSIQLAAGTTVLAGTVAMNATNDVATVTYSGDVSPSLTLTVTTGALDATGAALASAYTQSFPAASGALGNGYITGGVFDATTGRPLAGAAVTITPPVAGTVTTDSNGRYTMSSLGEGAFTIQASASGFTTVWRQVVVPAGSGIVPIDIRLTQRGTPQNGGADLTLKHGGDTPVTKPVQLFVPAAALSGGTVSLTAVGGQSLAGLLPLGWSPLASAEIALGTSSIPAPLPASKLTFVITSADADALTAATQTLSVVQYDSTRDEWRTIVAAANVAAGSDSTTRVVTADIQTSGNYALVYPDKGGPAGLVSPEAAHTGTALQGVPNPCTNTPAVCQPKSTGFNLDPPSVTPTQRATATLTTDGTDKTTDGSFKIYPSGTAVQAYIDEQLTFANTVTNGAPYATDLLLYRTPSGTAAAALFHVAPSPDANTPVLTSGVDHVRIVDYPGRIDRGTLIGSEGGRIPGDDTISIQIPQGATTDALHASVVPMTATDIQSFGTIPGFHIAGGFTLSLSDPSAPKVDLNGDGNLVVVPVTLLQPAQGTFTIDLAKFPTPNRQVVIAEVIDKSSFGSLVRLANTTTPSTTTAPGALVVTTEVIDRTKLPLDGIVHDGRYLMLTADNDVAFAWGQMRLGSATGLAVSNALVTAGIGSTLDSPLGVQDLTRAGGLFALPVAAGTATPYSLKPRSVATGDGDPTVASAAPVKNDKVPFGTLVLAPKPLQLVSITPNNAEVPTSGFQAVATFNIAVDPNSVSGHMIVKNLTTGTVVAGTVAGDGGAHVTFTPAQSLASGSTYSIIVQAGILSTGGAPLQTGGSATFTTPVQPPANAHIDPTKTQITIPQNGISRIKGSAGALPVGAVALAVRRNQYFIDQYQVNVGADGTTDGSFSFSIGTAGGADAVSISDHIDLQIQDAVSRSTIAIIPLTPFVTTDGLGFVAPTGQTVTFTSVPPSSVSVTVPAGAFATPTLVTVAGAQQSDFSAVPSFNTELGFYAAITLTFNGTASKPLELDIPAPGADPTKTYLLGRLGDSSLGPRVEIDDLISLVNGKFTTRAQGSSSGQRVTRATSVSKNDTLVGTDVRNYLLRTIESGKYTVIDIRVPTGSSVGWAAMDGLQTNLDLFMDLYHSLFVSHFYLVSGHGRAVIPVATNTPFTIQGVDAATGIQLFQHTYDPIPPTSPGQVTGIPALATNTTGPYPLFGDPFSIQTAEVIGGVDSIDSVNGVTIDTSTINKSGQGLVTVAFKSAAGTDPVAAPHHLRVYNVRSGELSADDTAMVKVNAKVGDLLVVYLQSDRIDPRSDMSIVFNESINVLYNPSATQAANDAAMRPLFQLWKNTPDSSGTANWAEVSAQTSFSVDSGSRRVILHTDLQSGAEYRIHIDQNISDTDTSPLKLMTVPGGPSPLAGGLDLYFAVRTPKGTLNGFKLMQDSSGSIRDLALDGNLLFVSAQAGGLFAYDVSDPASLSGTGPQYAWAPALGGESWSVSVDNHGRVWTTALTGEFGVVRSFRTEQFVDKLTTSTTLSDAEVQPWAGGAVSWRTGINVGIDDGLSTTLISDRPEATPRKLQVVTQDDSFVITVGNDFNTKFGANTLGATLSGPNSMVDGEFADYSISVPSSTSPDFYVSQRITVRNVTAGLRWSVDAPAGPASGDHQATFAHVLVRGGDQIRVDRNERTYGAVSLFGYGVGIYDLNALESNSLVAQGTLAPGYAKLGTLIDLTDGQGVLTFSPDAVVYADNSSATPQLTSLSCLAATGVASYVTQQKTGLEQNTPNEGQPVAGGTSPVNPVNAQNLLNDPTLAAIATAFTHAGRPKPFGRFNSIAHYDVIDSQAIAHSYALVSAGGYGILVLNTDQPGSPAIVDVIWVAHGAWAIRTTGSHYATSIDGEGKTLLIDLSRIDESAAVPAPACPSGCSLVFPSLAASLANPGTDPTYFGTDDPRVVWRGNQLAANTTLAAVGDPNTGFFFGGTILDTNVRVESGIDPRVTLKANLAGGLTSLTSIVPLGIQPPKDPVDPSAIPPVPCATSGIDVQQPTPCLENTSHGVFRIEMNLPGGVMTTITGSGSSTVDVAVESERVIDGITEQTPAPFPPAHLRQKTPAIGTAAAQADARPTTFSMHRILDDSATAGAQKYLRLQSGFNRFVSPWIIAIADPRASSQYKWSPDDTATRDAAGCFQCTLPPFLSSASGRQLNTDFFELYTLGRYITVRPEGTTFASGNYKFLGDRHRVFARFATIPADTVRPAQALVAAQAPPVATGKIQETVYLHSGEVETSTVDLDAGGRAGWNVAFDRTYRSRTVGFTAFGDGWDSSILARLRPLPTGEVEYRDGSGEVWLFTPASAGGYDAGKGVFLQLVNTEQGWTLIDQKRRITYFDSLGRITKSTDEFFKPTGEGNVILYNYDQNGRLASVTDPVDRTTKITYGAANAADEGFVKSITDWWTNQSTPTGGRTVGYTYNTNGTLKEVQLPAFQTQSGTPVSPVRHYDYDTGSGYANQIELATNLVKIVDPTEQATGGPARVTFGYNPSLRDYVATQTWPSGELITFGFTQGASATATTIDALHQVRTYKIKPAAAPASTDSKLTWYSNDRAHVDSMIEQQVEVAAAGFGALPPSGPLDPTAAPATTKIDRETKYGYNADGTLSSAAVTGGPQKTLGYDPIGKLGMVTKSVTTSGPGATGSQGRKSANDVPSSLTIEYGHDGTSDFLQSITAGGLKVEQNEARRDSLSLTDTNSVKTTSSYDAQGRATSIASDNGTATCTGDCGAATKIVYPPDQPNVPLHARGLPSETHEGRNADDVPTKFSYDNETQTTVTDSRNVATKTIYDSWRRPIDVTVSSPGDPLKMEDQYDYDASGRLHAHRRQQDGQTVTTTYAYDPMGRTSSVTTDHIATDNTPTIDTYDYSQFSNGTIVHTVAGAATTINLDPLGRTKRSETVTGTPSNIVAASAYDIADNPVYSTDTLAFATAMAYDPSGRRTDLVHTDGSLEHFDYDGWGHVKAYTRKGKDGTVVYSRTTGYQPDGQVATVTESGGGGSRTTTRTWDGGGRTAAVSVNGGDGTPRASQSDYDTAGRIKRAASGTGSATAITAFTEASWPDYGNTYLAPTVNTTENKQGTAQQYSTQRGFDTAGNAKSFVTGGLQWQTQFDEAGNVKSAKDPARGTHVMNHNAAGAVTTETLADGSPNQSHDIDATGSGKAFNDPTGEATSVTPDKLGRPLTITYKDTTTQVINYAGARVAAVKDRQDRWQSFVYENGHITEIWASQTPRDGNAADQLDKIEYDPAGRVEHWTTPDARIDYENLTLDGLPQLTRLTRYSNHSGLTSSPQVLDQPIEQTHGYNGHGERTSFSIPGGGAAGWASNASIKYDAMGNIQLLTTDGGLSLTGDYRAAGRPNSRKITLPVTNNAAKTLQRSYTYTPGTGQLQEMRASIVDGSGNKLDVAGSHVTYNGLQVGDANLLGVSSNQRHTTYSYDQRSRVAGSVTAATGSIAAPPPGGEATAPGAIAETPDAADFRSKQTRAPMLDAAAASVLQSRGVDTTAIDPPTQTATPAPGHKIATWSRGPSTRTFDFGGKSELLDDGQFHYHYDVKGRLDWVAEHATSAGAEIRRILYTYDGNNRLIGRTAQAADVTTLPVSYDTLPWNLETRQQFIAADGIPAEMTFVWDPISDRIITVVRANNSRLANDPNNNTLKQIIHGDMGYDDPVEVTTVDTSVLVGPGQAQPVTKLYPIYDEAAGGTLQVVVNRNGEVVARSVNNDPFGGSEFDLAGAAIDHVDIQTKKDASGALDLVTVTMRATEQLAAATVNTGARLAVVDSNGALVRTAEPSPMPAANDPYTVTWTLTAAQWVNLSDPTAVNGNTPVSLSIAATTTLRAALWKVDLPILPPPDWATASKPVYSSATLAVEVRESLANIAAGITATNPSETHTTVTYDVPNLGLLGSSAGNPDIESMMAATFQAQPFAEPFTKKSFVRGRWFDAQTGAWLTPDARGYRDSSNLYAYAAGDPVNGRDPTGEAVPALATPLPPAPPPPTFTLIQGGGGTAAETTGIGTGGVALGTVGGLAVAGIFTETVGRWIPSGEPGKSIKDWWEEHTLQPLADKLVGVPQAAAPPRPRTPQVPMLPGVTPYSQQAQANPALAPQLVGYHNDEVGGGSKSIGSPPDASQLVRARIAQLQAAIPENSKGRITMAVAVVEDSNGTRSVLVSTSEPRGYLRPGVTLHPGETMVHGTGHAEDDIVNYAKAHGLRIIGIGATRPVCAACQDAIAPTGANIETPLKLIRN